MVGKSLWNDTSFLKDPTMNQCIWSMDQDNTNFYSTAREIKMQDFKNDIKLSNILLPSKESPTRCKHA